MEPEANELPNEEDSQKIKKEDEEIDWERKEGITIKEVETTVGLTHLTDNQAEEVINFIETYCMLIFSLHQKELQDKKQDNENNEEPKNKAA